MNTILCPACKSQAVSYFANITACPNCYHPYDFWKWSEYWSYVRNMKKEGKLEAEPQQLKKYGECLDCGKNLISHSVVCFDCVGKYKKCYWCGNVIRNETFFADKYDTYKGKNFCSKKCAYEYVSDADSYNG